MLQLQLPSLELILIAARGAALLLALLGFCWAFGSWKRAIARDTQRVFEQLDLIRNDVRELAEQVQTLMNRQETRDDSHEVAARFALPPVPAAPRGYEVAVRLAKTGATREELITNCGISRHEADLLLRLHGAAKDAGNAVVSEPAQSAAPAPAAQSHSAPNQRRRLSVVG